MPVIVNLFRRTVARVLLAILGVAILGIKGSAVKPASGAPAPEGYSIVCTPVPVGFCSFAILVSVTPKRVGQELRIRASNVAEKSGSSLEAKPWPDAATTGVAQDVVLRLSGSLTINTPQAVISGLDITGQVIINAPNVTLKNCHITYAGFTAVRIADGLTGVTVQNCEINGTGANNSGENGIWGPGTFLNNNIYNVENGIVPGSGSLVQDNYIHDLLASGSPHYDGIQIDGASSNISIIHNTIYNPHNQTSAVMIDNYFGPISNINVHNNLLLGGGYVIYVDGHFGGGGGGVGGTISGVTVTNNHFGLGYWGVTVFNKTSPIFSGNFDDGGTLVRTLNLDVRP